MDDSIYRLGYPPNNACARLTALVQSVCPADGVSIGRWDDRATWRLDAMGVASATEIAAAEAVMATFDPWAGDTLGADLLAPAPEPEQPAAHETDSETVQEGEGGGGAVLDSEGNIHVRLPAGLGVLDSTAEEVVDDAGDADAGGQQEEPGIDPIDADFSEVAPEFDGLDEPDPGDFAAIEGADLGAEILDEEAPAGAFIFGDNIHQQRIVRIGQLAEHAAAMIADTRATVAWNDTEFADLQSHVVANLDKATGAYTGGDHEAYSRFVALSEAQARIRSIGAYRDARQDEVRGADREAVEAFNPEEGWP